MRSVGEPGPDALAVAVTRAARARGAEAKADALLTVSAVAEAWAAKLLLPDGRHYHQR